MFTFYRVKFRFLPGTTGAAMCLDEIPFLLDLTLLVRFYLLALVYLARMSFSWIYAFK